MTIQEAQETVDRWINTTGVRYFSELTNMAILAEEVGEVARVIQPQHVGGRAAVAQRPVHGFGMILVPGQHDDRDRSSFAQVGFLSRRRVILASRRRHPTALTGVLAGAPSISRTSLGTR